MFPSILRDTAGKWKNKTVPEAINATLEQILPFYQRARIPTLFRNKMGQEIKKLWEELKSINKTTKAKREGGSEKINGFKEKLDRTMTFWPRDAFERIQNEEDKLFLQSMMCDRTATLGPVYNVLANTENKVLRGRHREEEQRKKLMQPRACHRARWMAKIIYACKVAFLSDLDKKAKTKILCRGSFQKLNVSFSSSCTCIFQGDWLLLSLREHLPMTLTWLINYNKISRSWSCDGKEGHA